MSGATIELRGLSRRYGSRPVLDGVDARIAPGELVVVVGRSGSGKSTLLNLIGAIDLPDAGELLVDGTDIVPLPESRRALLRRHRIGFVFQSFNLIPTLTVCENLRLPLELTGQRPGAARERALRMLIDVGLEDTGDRLPGELSGGEQQRVAIARALVHRPGLVLADEPTGNLDLETARKMIALIDGLCRRTGTTLIMATHSREVMGVADRCLTITDGRLERMP